jgi:hypothetical protein
MRHRKVTYMPVKNRDFQVKEILLFHLVKSIVYFSARVYQALPLIILATGLVR